MKDPSGNVALVVALFMAVLFSVLSLVIDAGYLYSAKNRYQNSVEAAAMAGAVSLCDEDPAGVARQIALENGLPAGSLVVRVGFYDQNDEYNDFPEYKDFVWEESDSYPEEEYNNAVMVKLSAETETLMGGFTGKDKVAVGAAAVAYLKRYGMLSLGEDDDDGITFTNYFDSEPEITGGNIHANNDITFAASPDIDAASVTVSAGGTISGYDGGISGVDPIYIKPVSAYLDDLYARADKIITEDDFPSSTGIANGITDEFGNVYYRTDSRLIFNPHTGDHGGMIYYFSGDGDVLLGNSNNLGDGVDPEEEITNLTFAADKRIQWSVGGNDAWGGENENQVTIIAGEDIDFGGMAISDETFEPRGVVFLAGGDIKWRNAAGMHSITYGIRNLRMIVEGSIKIEGPGSWRHFEAAFNLAFGPPCPPYDVRLGRLVTP